MAKKKASKSEQLKDDSKHYAPNEQVQPVPYPIGEECLIIGGVQDPPQYSNRPQAVSKER